MKDDSDFIKRLKSTDVEQYGCISPDEIEFEKCDACGFTEDHSDHCPKLAVSFPPLFND